MHYIRISNWIQMFGYIEFNCHWKRQYYFYFFVNAPRFWIQLGKKKKKTYCTTPKRLYLKFTLYYMGKLLPGINLSWIFCRKIFSTSLLYLLEKTYYYKNSNHLVLFRFNLTKYFILVTKPIHLTPFVPLWLKFQLILVV